LAPVRALKDAPLTRKYHIRIWKSCSLEKTSVGDIEKSFINLIGGSTGGLVREKNESIKDPGSAT